MPAVDSGGGPTGELALILEHMACGIIVHDAHGTTRAVNRRALELLGLSEADAYTRTGRDARWNVVDATGAQMPPDAHPAVIARASLQAVHGVEMGIHHSRTGTCTWVEVSAVPQLSPSGRPQMVVITLTDVTERRRTLEAYERERQLREEALRTLPVGVLVLDGHDRVLMASDQARRLLDIPQSRGGPIVLRGALVGPGGLPLPASGQPSQRVRAAGEPLHGERYIWSGRSGRRRVLLFSGSRLQSAQWPDGVILAFHDITQREASSRAIRHSERRLTAALRAADLGRIDVDFRRRTTSVDPNWLARHGFPAALAEADFPLWTPRLGPTDRQTLRAAIARHRGGSAGTVEAEVWLRREDDTKARIRFIGQIEGHGSDGRILSLAGVLMDITDQHVARVAAARLEANAAEMARLEGVAAVAGGAAHTLANLLVGVQGAIDSAQERLPEDSQLAESLEILSAAGARAAEVSTQLRAVSGRSPFALRPVHLDVLVWGSRAMLQSGLEGRCELQVRVAAPIPCTEVDVDQLRLVLMNLVLNAADASSGPRQVVELGIRAVELEPGTQLEGLAMSSEPAPGPYVVVEVLDRGHGMTPAVRQRMFEPFFTTRDDRRGLGLSAVLGVANGHNGFVQVRSSSGQGTSVAIGLPVVERLQEPVSAPTPVCRPPTSTVPRRVLVVDDESMIRRLVQRVLERTGYAVDVADGGHAALDLLEEGAERYSLILLDLTMPEFSGQDVLRVVLERWPGVPVLVMSGFVDDSEIGSFMVASGVRFLPKPFGADELRAAVAATWPDEG